MAERPITSLPFSDYIRKLPSDWVFAHFLKSGSSSRRILSLSAIQEQIKRFSTPEALKKQFNELCGELQMRCALTYLLGGSGFPEKGTITLDDPLLRSFLVYAAKNGSGQIRLFGFSEFESLLRPALAETLAKAMTANEASAKGKNHHPRQGCNLSDFAVIATLAAQGRLERKQNGELTRNVQLLLKKLLPASSQAEAATWGEFLAAYGVHCRVLRDIPDGYTLVTKQFEEWLERPARERTEGLERFAVVHGGSWNLPLLKAVITLHPDHLFSCKSFPEEENAIEALRMLHFSGLVDLFSAGTNHFFGAPRETKAVMASVYKPVIILPDFSAILSQEIPPEEIARFGRIGELHALDRVYKGKICRAVLANSLSGGIEGETIIGWLIEWQAPANVITTVREWVREFSRLFVTDSAMLIVTEEKVAAQIRGFAPLSKHLEPVPVHALFRIHEGAQQKVTEQLAELGFDHRMPIRQLHCGEDVVAESQARADDPVWEPMVCETREEEKSAITLKGKKYGSGLKKLDLNETMHIIDYAILTGGELAIEYAGSPLLKKGHYVVTPRGSTKGTDPLLEGTLRSGKKKLFHVRRIERIAVESP